MVLSDGELGFDLYADTDVPVDSEHERDATAALTAEAHWAAISPGNLPADILTIIASDVLPDGVTSTQTYPPVVITQSAHVPTGASVVLDNGCATGDSNDDSDSDSDSDTSSSTASDSTGINFEHPDNGDKGIDVDDSAKLDERYEEQ
ncbi:hypothetical protein HDU84_001793 [Entophlyctis sp. JEL0112]|nr:hypothetical protein HDU84_001793 [Entophlyctis sp. JEL0112]